MEERDGGRGRRVWLLMFRGESRGSKDATSVLITILGCMYTTSIETAEEFSEKK